MGFLADIITLMTGDASINNYVNGGIRYEHLPTDFRNDQNWIVFGYTVNDTTDTLSTKNVFTEYNLEIQVVSPSSTTVLDMSDRLTSYLQNYSSISIGDITLLDDDLNFNSEKAVYYKTLNYNVIYRN